MFRSLERYWEGQPTWAVCCPLCQDDYVHIESVKVNRGGKEIEVAHDSEARLSLTSASARGAFIAVSLWCENGHSFSMTLQFHKGQTFLFSSNAQKANEEQCLDLWRD